MSAELSITPRASRFVNAGGARRIRVSFEFFPPKTEEMEKTQETRMRREIGRAHV